MSPPTRLNLLCPCEERARPLCAEAADDAANLPKRAALGLAEGDGDLLDGPPVLRPQARAGRGGQL